MADGWQEAGSNVVIVATGIGGWVWASWSGTTGGCVVAGNRITVPMDRPRSVNAAFLPDTVAPTPDPMTWATLPQAMGPAAITMTATAATDPSGVEYYFTNTAGGGHDSGWQDSAAYTDFALTPSVTYSYRVKARDKSTNRNETAYSDTRSATTP